MENLLSEPRAKKSDNLQVAEINKNFLIRYKFDQDKKSCLVSAGKYHTIVGEELAQRHFVRVMKEGEDRYTIRLRRGLTIDFVSK